MNPLKCERALRCKTPVCCLLACDLAFCRSLKAAKENAVASPGLRALQAQEERLRAQLLAARAAAQEERAIEAAQAAPACHSISTCDENVFKLRQ